MKLTPNKARDMVAKELAKGNGIYIDGRYFEVRVNAGVLQVSDFNSWFDVAPGSTFRNAHGRDLFKYEPLESGPVKFETIAEGECFIFERVKYRKTSEFAAVRASDKNSLPDNFIGCLVTPKGSN